MQLKNLVLKNRSIRRFDQTAEFPRSDLIELVKLARLSPSGANKQALKFVLSTESAMNRSIFPCLKWAGYLTDWGGPAEGERPSAYVIILLDTEISDHAGCDHGIAAQTMLLGAVEKGWAGCMIGSIDRTALARVLGLTARYEIMLVIALGKPAEKVVVEDVGMDGDICYWRDEKGIHHVPKRPLKELILQGME